MIDDPDEAEQDVLEEIVPDLVSSNRAVTHGLSEKQTHFYSNLSKKRKSQTISDVSIRSIDFIPRNARNVK
jgi:hypothetical protein